MLFFCFELEQSTKIIGFLVAHLLLKTPKPIPAGTLDILYREMKCVSDGY